ncbi:MAG: class I SAM-dependent methyltransferase [Halobacteriovoraceae bacterium]|nr:class I SAM-dependent methyltransferase [Halobacteriovoraceae bacterium]
MKSHETGPTKAALLDLQYEQTGNRKNPNPSLKSFLKTSPLNDWLVQVLDKGPWCEIGSGPYSLFEEGDELVSGLENKKDIWGFDLSQKAVELSYSDNVRYQVQDISEGLPFGPYSFILDGHLLHCLTSLPELFQTLGVILNALKPGGYFAGEVMIAHKNLSFDHDLFYDFDTNILSFGDRPLRIILEPREWEELFVGAGFKIQFFVCQSSIKMIPHRDRTVAMSGDPECLRFVLQKPSEEEV